MGHIFLSYSRVDADILVRLYNALIHSGRAVWVDFADIQPTGDWSQAIRSAIIASDAFVYLISPDSIESNQCSAELEFAMKFEKRIIPVLVRDVDVLDKMHTELKSRRWINFRETDDSDLAFAELENALAHDPEYLLDHTRFLTRAEEWVKKGRHRDYLLRGVALAEAENWLKIGKERDPKPSMLHEEYVSASQQESRQFNERLMRSAARMRRILRIAPVRKIFISYRRQDSQLISDRIYDSLTRRFPPNLVFFDIFSIDLGVDFASVIQRTLNQCAVVLVVIGPQWTTLANETTGEKRLFEANDFVRLEVETALYNPEIRVMPLLVGGAGMPPTADLPLSIKRLVQINGTVIRPGRDFHDDMENVIQQIIKAQRTIAIDMMRYDES